MKITRIDLDNNRDVRTTTCKNCDLDQLNNKVMANIVDRLLSELSQQLIEKSVKLDVTDAARKWLVVHGQDKELGARPLHRSSSWMHT